ncbi:uncharacterized protein MCYG_04098 [Microsporum canis CBS 113480]|uniref:Uncharacterized protein n=1 Tax=Arthroderma otae (strain ATCC MYA-4605 / CBS 113480) TaxID=554155 RepID=C5FN43_ARTOC|nr:uncharacterized protein MCYG_04098 [Microsporum canis CBS 113480]EEQ31279.1 predicted protein [Microsporum canis CBS 113480]
MMILNDNLGEGTWCQKEGNNAVSTLNVRIRAANAPGVLVLVEFQQQLITKTSMLRLGNKATCSSILVHITLQARVPSIYSTTIWGIHDKFVNTTREADSKVARALIRVRVKLKLRKENAKNFFLIYGLRLYKQIKINSYISRDSTLHRGFLVSFDGTKKVDDNKQTQETKGLDALPEIISDC